MTYQEPASFKITSSANQYLEGKVPKESPFFPILTQENKVCFTAFYVRLNDQSILYSAIFLSHSAKFWKKKEN